MNVPRCVPRAGAVVAKSLFRRVGGVVTQRIANPKVNPADSAPYVPRTPKTDRERIGNVPGPSRTISAPGER